MNKLLILALGGAVALPSVPHAAAPPPPVLITVTNTADAGAGSLRDAILAANAVAAPGTARIEFDILVAGVQTITPLTDLPALTVRTQLDGYTQPGALRAAGAVPATLMIVINAVNTTRGLELDTDGSTVSGLVVRGSTASAPVGAACANDGICVLGDGNVITGNYVGMGAAGLAPFGNDGDGIDVQGDDNVVGGLAAGDRNLVSGNGNAGVNVHGSGNRVEGNLVGLNANGSGSFGNGGSGVSLTGSTNTVGGNVISNNGRDGAVLSGDNNTIKGNFIGTNGAGTAGRGNIRNGVFVAGAGNQVGGAAAGEGNVVSGNGGDGVFLDPVSSGTLVRGNKIGTGVGGNSAIPNSNGVVVQGDDNVVGGAGAGEGNVISGNTVDGVEVAEPFGTSSAGNRVEGNLIGTTRSGNGALGNGDDGVSVTALTAGNRVGGSAPGAGNVIAANGSAGVYLFGGGSIVEGNLIGVDDTGLAVLPNAGDGVEVRGDGSWIGGHAAGAGNVISGNGGNGVAISATGTRVMGNAIGTDLAGTAGLGNTGSGVAITSGTGNRIGSVDPAEPPNTIAFNGQDGVAVTGGTDHPIRRNAIFSNGSLGIDLDANGVLANDAGDVDSGDNDLQNYPVVGAAGATSVAWSLDGQVSTDYRIEFFANPACSGSGNGEGRTFLGSVLVSTTAASGVVNAVTPVAAPVGQFLTATATVSRPGALTGPTSEFSTCVLVV